MGKNSLNQADNQIDTLPEGYKDILASIILKIKAAQARALKAVNQELIEVYRDIGRTIHEKQEQREWGDSVVERLAKDLQNGFPGIKGFSSRNLWRMRDLYKTYQGSEKLTTLSSEISWSHNVALLSKCKDLLEKEFYMKMSKRNGWTYRVLIHHITLFMSFCIFKFGFVLGHPFAGYFCEDKSPWLTLKLRSFLINDIG